MATLKQLATLVDAEVVGDENIDITRLAPIDGAGRGDITFIANPKYLPCLDTTAASAVLVDRPLGRADVAYLVCSNPYLAFAKVLTYLNVEKPAPLGVLPGARVSESAKLGERVTVHPGANIGAGCSVGDDCIIYPNVVIYPQVKIGDDCLIHAGCVIREQCELGDRVILQPNVVIGSDGFGFAPDGDGYYKIPQVGIVIIENDVEIGAGSCVDRAAMGVTRIGRGCKLDNLVQIGHNVSIGADTVVASQSGIAGSTAVGRHCTLGGQSAISGHLKVGDNLTLGGRGGVTGSIKGDQVVSGLPAIPHREWLKSSMSFSKLPQMRKDIAALKRQLDQLQQAIKED
ncbi:MAG: UDP-3-O-(3-hydroxymyristoyl)glucosamine N-acyltransferase [Desulfobacteraceae bacterium 4572_35.1]|nr:MAG: UDP-3-O-(3-hydroxymyristoyl)glucosamine N-acyltransferase [Desulfobacteraceae bacterium 4572_35.1]